MFFKLLQEDGDYKTQSGERVNLISGNKIFTPNGEVTSDNLQGFIEFESLDEALNYFGLEVCEQKD